MSERAWLEAADRPPAWTTSRGKVTREDLFNEIDILRARVAEKDGMLDSGIRASLTRVRSLAATLVPASPRFVCGFVYRNGVTCSIQCSSEEGRRVHQKVVHGVAA